MSLKKIGNFVFCIIIIVAYQSLHSQDLGIVLEGTRKNAEWAEKTLHITLGPTKTCWSVETGKSIGAIADDKGFLHLLILDKTSQKPIFDFNRQDSFVENQGYYFPKIAVWQLDPIADDDYSFVYWYKGDRMDSLYYTKYLLIVLNGKIEYGPFELVTFAIKKGSKGKPHKEEADRVAIWNLEKRTIDLVWPDKKREKVYRAAEFEGKKNFVPQDTIDFIDLFSFEPGKKISLIPIK